MWVPALEPGGMRVWFHPTGPGSREGHNLVRKKTFSIHMDLIEGVDTGRVEKGDCRLAGDQGESFHRKSQVRKNSLVW